jgi:hypothetical protein
MLIRVEEQKINNNDLLNLIYFIKKYMRKFDNKIGDLKLRVKSVLEKS